MHDAATSVYTTARRRPRAAAGAGNGAYWRMQPYGGAILLLRVSSVLLGAVRASSPPPIVYTKLLGTDSGPGGALHWKQCVANCTCAHRSGPCPIAALKQLCAATPHCAGFNSNGWLKSCVSTSCGQTRRPSAGCDLYVGSEIPPGAWPPPPPKQPVAPPGPAPGPWHPQPPGPPPTPLPPMPPVSPPAPVPQVADWHYPSEESAELAALRPISILSVNATTNISGSILVREEGEGPSTPLSVPQRLVVGELPSSGWMLRSFIVSSTRTEWHEPLPPPIAVLERDWGRWGLVVYVQQQWQQQEDRMLPVSLLEGRGCPGIVTAKGGPLPTMCFAIRKGVGDTSALERPRYQLEAADPDYFVKARDIPTDWLKARMFMTKDGEPTFNSAASLLPPSKDYAMVGNVAAHTKISVSPDGRMKSGNHSIFVAMEWGNVTGGSLLFDPRDHVAYWPVHNFSEYKSAVIGRFTRAVSVSAWDKAARRGFAMLVAPNTYRGIQRGGGKAAAAYDPAEVLVRLEEHGYGAKATRAPAKYFAVQDCGSLTSPLCYNDSTRALPDGGQFYAHLLLHTLEWDRFHSPSGPDNNVASKPGVAKVRPLQLSVQSPAAENEGRRMVDMSRAVISSAMTMYLDNRPNYGDGSVYWSVTAHDAGSLPLESFALNRVLLLWGHPHEAASRVEFYLNAYVRNSSGWTPTNPPGMTRNTLWNSSGYGPPGSLDLKQWGCGHGPGGAMMPHNFQESLADYGRWLELWVELARVMEHEVGGIAWIERTWNQVNQLLGYTLSLHSEAIQAQHPFPAAGLIVGPAEHDTCAYYGPFFSISAWTWRGWKAIYSFLMDTGTTLPQAVTHQEALPRRMETLSSALDAAVNASLVKNDTNQPYFLPPLAQVNATPYTSMIMRGAPGTSGSSSYANFRYYAEMLSSGYLSDDIAHAISDFRESHTGTLSAMTRFLDHLDDMPAEGYARSALELSRVQSFQALLFGHAANYHSRGVYNAPEQLSLYGDGVPGRWTYSDSYRAYLKGAINEVDVDFCLPSTTLPAIMLRWMMLFTERDEDVIVLFRAAPRRFFRPPSSSQATTVNTIELVGGVTRYGIVDANVSVASTSTGLSIQAGIVLRMHGRGFVTSTSKHLRLEVRLRSPRGYRLVAANVSAVADVDVSVMDIDSDTGTVTVLLKPGSAPNDYVLSLVASSQLSDVFDAKYPTLSLASTKTDDVGAASTITYTRIPNTTTGDTLRLKRCTVNITCSGTPTCCYNPHGPHPGGRGLFCAIPQLEEACRSTPGCAGFDTDGWLKADVSGARVHGTFIDTYIGSSKAPGQFPPPEPLPPPPAPAPPGPPTPTPPHGSGNPLHENVTGVVDVEHADHIGPSFLDVFVGWGACNTTLCSKTELESSGVFQRCFEACKAHDQCGLWLIAPKYVHGSAAPNCWLMKSYGQRQLNLGYWSMCTELAADGTCRQIQKPKMKTYQCNGTQCVPGASNLSFTDPSCFGQCSRLKHDDVDPQQRPLFAPQFIPLDVGAVVPEGWLLKQLILQAEGLSGHLMSFWPDVQHSMWLNGANIHGDLTGNHSVRGHYKDDGGLHERGTYWLNGFVPLAFQLSAAGVEVLYPKCDRQSQHHKDSQAKVADEREILVEPVRPMEQMRTFIDAILASVNITDGWIGPGDRPTTSDSGHPPDGGIYWGRSNALQSLIQYAEGQRSFGGGDLAEFDRVAHVVKNYFLCQKRMMAITPLEAWSRSRWIDMALSVAWVIDNASPTAAETLALMELGAQLHQQGDNWEEWFQFAGPGGRGTGITFEKGHNVNNAQALKWSAVLYRFTGNATMRNLGLSSMANIDQHYGLPTGMFNGDEILPDPPTRNPSRGIETCGVVEAMFSYTTLGAVHGSVAFFDRAERIAFNALPAAWASPRGGDMWAHPYLQSVNEVQAIEADPHIWEHDDHWAETFGLEPTFGCCTANFNQGWPKLIKQAVMATPDGGAAVTLLLPTNATLPDGGTVTVETNYPFEDNVRISCKAARAKQSFPLQIRIPGWARNASINGKRVSPGEFSHQTCGATGASRAIHGDGGLSFFMLQLAPQIELEEWAGDLNADGEAPHTAYSVVRGPILYSLPIEHEFIEYAHHYGSGDEASNDYFLTPRNGSAWNYALVVDPHDTAKGLRFVSGEPHAAGAAPFNRTGPLSIHVQARRVPAWSMFANSAAAPPQSPVCGDETSPCGSVETIVLVPHGYTELRIGEFPLA